MDFIWLICLCITHMVAYYIGRNDGSASQLSEEGQLEIQRYEIDKRFEHLRWTAERNEKHEG